MTVINRIDRLQHPSGVLCDFTWPKDLSGFGRYNLVYGWNGTGKTTLSNLLRALELRDAPEGNAKLAINNGIISGSEFNQSTVPIRVFNREYVSESVFPVGGGDVPPIYVVGKKSADKQVEVEQLKAKQSAASEALGLARNEKVKAEKLLDKHCVDQATVIRETLRSSGNIPYNNYDKSRYKKRAKSMIEVGDKNSYVLTDKEKEQLISQTRAMLKARLYELQYQIPNLDRHNYEVSILLKKSVVSSAIDKLKSDPKLAAWTRQGLGLHLERNAEYCLFCEQNLPDERISILEAHFSTEYEELLGKLDAKINELEAVLSSVKQWALPKQVEFYEDLAADFNTLQSEFYDAKEVIRAYFTDLLKALQDKRERLFESISIEINVPQVRLSIIEDINALVRNHNEACDDFDSRINLARQNVEASFVANSLDEYQDLHNAIDHQIAMCKAEEEAIKQTKSEVTKLENDIIQHRQPAEELNKELQKYLGHDELQFEVKDTGYSITRNGVPAQGLSEGEMTAIALLYFLKSLTDHEFQMSKGVVVLDDPVSSLDDNALFLAFGFIRQRTENAAQVFIFTHNFPLFRQVRNWFHHLKGQNKSDIAKQPARFYMLECVLTNSGRRSSLKRLDPLLEKFESEYHYLFACIYRRVQISDQQDLEKNYIFPNMARRLLETFLAFRQPQHSGELRKKLENTEFDETKKLRILRFLHTHSHAEAIGEPDHDPSFLSETKAVLTDLLELVKHEDLSHYNAMVDLLKDSGT